MKRKGANFGPKVKLGQMKIKVFNVCFFNCSFITPSPWGRIYIFPKNPLAAPTAAGGGEGVKKGGGRKKGAGKRKKMSRNLSKKKLN